MVKYVIVKVTQDTNDEHYFGWEHVKVPEEVTKGRAQITEFNNLADAVEAAGKAIEWEWHDRAIKLPEDVRSEAHCPLRYVLHDRKEEGMICQEGS